MKRSPSVLSILLPLVAALAVALSSCGSGKSGPSFAFVTNGVDPFWVIAKRGAEDAGKELGVAVEVLMPNGAPDQNQMLEDLVTRGAEGIAVSPIAPENQTGLLNRIAKATKLITHDSDAPRSDRICLIGTDNYDAGRACGRLVKEACPEGGNAVIFVGRLEQANARLRRMGVIDELLSYERDPARKLPADKAVTSGKWTILGTMTDQFDRSRAKSNCEDMLTKHEKIACVIGLFAYNVPSCLEALRASGRTGDVKVVGFDEDERTLQAIVDGDVHGTVVQDPYGYGYRSIQMLAKLAKGDSSEVPEGKIIHLPCRQIRRAQVEEFWKQLKERRGEN